MQRTIAVVIGVLSLIVGTGSAQADLITSDLANEHWVWAVNFNDGLPEPVYAGGGSNYNPWIPQFDGDNHGATSAINPVSASRSIGGSNYGDPNADTVVLKQWWDFRILTGAPYGSSTGAIQMIQFTPLEDVRYTIAGSFTAFSGDSEYIVALGSLNGGTGGMYHQQGGHHFVPGPMTYIAGGEPPDGGHSQTNTGPESLTGILQAGYVYGFRTHTYARSFGPNSPPPYNTFDKFDADGYSYGYGQTTLTLSSLDAVTSTPEPTSMALLGLASLGGIGLRLRRTRKTQDAQSAA